MPNDMPTPGQAEAGPAPLTPYGQSLAYPLGPPPPATLPVMPPEIAAAIMAVCREVKALRIDGTNTEQNFRFTSIDVFLEVVGGWCATAGLAILPEETSAEVIKQERWKQGNFVGYEQVLSCTYRFWLLHETGSLWQHPMTRRVVLRLSGPQSYGAAESYVMKRFMRALFKVPSGDALDVTSDGFDPDGGTAPAGPRGDGPRGTAPAADHLFGPLPAAERQDDGLFQAPEAAVEDPLWRGPLVPARVTGRIAPARSGQAALPSPGNMPEPIPAVIPEGGGMPFRVRDERGEVVAEYRDLKAWGFGIKRQLEKAPDSYAPNADEIDRLEAFFLADPTITKRSMQGREIAFATIRALAPQAADYPADLPPFTPPDDAGAYPHEHQEPDEPGTEG